MTNGRREQVVKLAERGGADGVIDVVADQHAQVRFVLVDIEMIEPEPDHALAQLIGRVERAQDGARRSLLGAIVHRLLKDLLCGLFLLGIGDLIGALGLLLEGDRNIEWEAVDVGHRLDLRLCRIGQRRIAGRVQLLLEPAFGTNAVHVRGTRGADAPAQSIEQSEIVRVEIVGAGGVCGKRHEHPKAEASQPTICASAIHDRSRQVGIA